MIARLTSHLRRLFDLLVVVAIAVGLLAIAWNIARDRGLEETAPLATLITSASLPDSPELQLLLPLEKFGMLLTREPVAGDAQQAVADLERKCGEVLASADEWVLSLAVSDEEQQLLDSLAGTEPLNGPITQPRSSGQLFPLTHPTGRAGIRVSPWRGGPFTPALSPTVESPETIESRMREREQKEPSPERHDSSAEARTAAATGRRLICWGFIAAEGTAGQTVWFARPREKLPRMISPEGHAP